MIRTIGLVELNSIARGIDVADRMVKAAEVGLIQSHTICPGKYIVLVSGDVGAVKSSVKAGLDSGKETVVDSLVLPHLHSDVIPALSKTTKIKGVNALGILESFSIAALIVAADAAAKTGRIKLIEVRPGLGIGGKSFTTLTGDVSAVKEAVEAGATILTEKGLLVDKTVIPSPHEDVFHSVM